MMISKNKFTGSLVFVLIFAGCAQSVEPASQPAQAEIAPTPSIAILPTNADDTSPAQTQETTQTEPETIEVTYFTPSQAEGPYYTVDKPEDRDNDLTDFAGADGIPEGEVIEFSGVVYDANGMPIPNVVIEIWQTVSNGVYLHPGDPGTSRRDPNFQFYGEAVTAEDGSYSFRTILPGRYEPRPRHIHVKLKFEGKELLTTQFYFHDDTQLEDEAMFTQVGGEGEHLIISLVEGEDADGSSIWVGERDLVLNVDLTP